jgi:hypothetical protein
MTSDESDGGPPRRVQKKTKREAVLITPKPSSPSAIATPQPLSIPFAEATPAIKTKTEKLKIEMAKLTDASLKPLVNDALGALNWECEIISMMHQAPHINVTRISDKMHDKIIEVLCDHKNDGKN